jgi:hypothetical protein
MCINLSQFPIGVAERFSKAGYQSLPSKSPAAGVNAACQVGWVIPSATVRMRAVVARLRLLPVAAAAGCVQADQLVQQSSALRVRRVGQEVLDGRPSSLLPGLLESVTNSIDVLGHRQWKRLIARPGRVTHDGTSYCQVLRISRSLRSTVRATPSKLRAILSMV